MKRFSLTLILFTVLFASCKSTKDNAGNQAISTEEVVVNPVYFTVSFISIGSGIDRKAKEAFTGYLEENYPSFSYETIKWGKEGEVDYCFNLSELQSEQRQALVNDAKEQLAVSERVRFHEGDSCKH